MKKFTTAFFLITLSAVSTFAQIATNVVISQVYGGGGNSGAPYTNDYIELFNPTSSPVVLTGWSVQYASATGTTWTTTNLTGIILAGSYFLIQEGTGGTNGVALPSSDATGTINMSTANGKLSLCNSTIALTGACPAGGTIIDFVGYGTTPNCFEGAATAPAPSNTMSIFRIDSSCTDANNNVLDFAAAAPDPRNSVYPSHICSPTGADEITNDETDILFYPNPVADKFTIYDLRFTILETAIFDVYGKLFFREQREAGSQEQTIDVSDLASGIYFLRITDGKNIRTAKFVKE